jgi:phenylpropionate dioxygenase-like ring-hydroxylating dioxygenase large terminal subunit
MPELFNKLLPEAWYPLCRAADLKPGQVLSISIGGEPYAVWRSASGKVSALTATCCHVGADLARGKVVGEQLQCPLHHWRYGAQGVCGYIPGGATIPARARQRSLPCCEAYGLVFAFLGDRPTFEMPHFAGESDPVWSRAAVVDVAAPYATLVANSYDGQHFAAVHGRDLLEPPQITRLNPLHIAIHYRAKVVGERLNDRVMRALGVDHVDVTIHCWGGSVLHVYNERTPNTILVALLPVDNNHSRVFILTALKARMDGAARLWQYVQLAISRWLAVAFLRPDMRVLEGVTMRLRVLLPGADDCLLAWLRYWRGLPRAREMKGEVSEADNHDEEAANAGAQARGLTWMSEPLSLERKMYDA